MSPEQTEAITLFGSQAIRCHGPYRFVPLHYCRFTLIVEIKDSVIACE